MEWLDILIGFMVPLGWTVGYAGLYMYEVAGVLGFFVYCTVVIIIAGLICDKACPDRLNRGCTKRP